MARQELTFLSPWLNAAGFCGFSQGGWPLEDPQGMFFTNPVSLKPRLFSSTEKAIPYPGGFLLRTGDPNPGLGKVLKSHAAGWRHSNLPVCVHIIPEDADQAAEMVEMIEAGECASAIEVECPPACAVEDMPEFWRAASGEMPLIAHLPAGVYGRDLTAEIRSAGVDAVSLGAPRGVIMYEDNVAQGGRLYGPSVLPPMLAALTNLRAAGLAVIAGGGLFRKSEAEAALAAGAIAVQLDAVLWRPGGWVI